MEYIWWLIIIFTYLFVLLFYAFVTYLIIKEEDRDKKLPNIDAIFFGITSVITISLMPIVKSAVEGFK